MDGVTPSLRNDANPYLSMQLPQLLDAQAKVEAELSDVKQIADQIDQAIRQRVAHAIAEARRDLGKETGTVHAVVDGCDVASVVPATEKWDSGILEETWSEIETMEGKPYNPAEWIAYSFSVPKAKYKALPHALKKLIDRALTTKHGKEQIKITKVEG